MPWPIFVVRLARKRCRGPKVATAIEQRFRVLTHANVEVDGLRRLGREWKQKEPMFDRSLG